MKRFGATYKISPDPSLIKRGKTKIGIDFLGYRLYPDHRLLRKDNSMRVRKNLCVMSKLYSRGLMKWDKINSSVQSWMGHAKHADTYGLRRQIFKEFKLY